MKSIFEGERFVLVTLLAVCFSFLNVVEAGAQVQTVEADGYYLIGDGPDENHSVAKDRARMDAKRAVAEKAGVLVESLSSIKDYQLTADEVNIISSQVLQIKSEKFTPEVVGETIRYCCHIVALVDSSDVMAKLGQERAKLYEAVQKNKQQEKELNAVKNELAALKEKYRTANEAARQEINRKVRNNEKKFKAAEWVEKGKEYDGEMRMECYRKAIATDSEYAPAWCAMGDYYNGLLYGPYNGEYEAIIKKAMKCYRKATEIDPEYGYAWHQWGYVCANMHDYKNAIKYYTKATEVEPQNGVNWYALGGVYYYDIQDWKKTIETYGKAAEVYGKVPGQSLREAECRSTMAWAYFYLGEHRKAVESMGRAMALEPMVYRANYNKILKEVGQGNNNLN